MRKYSLLRSALRLNSRNAATSLANRSARCVRVAFLLVSVARSHPCEYEILRLSIRRDAHLVFAKKSPPSATSRGRAIKPVVPPQFSMQSCIPSFGYMTIPYRDNGRIRRCLLSRGCSTCCSREEFGSSFNAGSHHTRLAGREEDFVLVPGRCICKQNTT